MTQALAAAAIVSGLVLAPFGPLADHFAKGGLWYGFDAKEGPVLTLVRAQKLGGVACRKWAEAVTTIEEGWVPLHVSPISETWSNWSEKDRKGIEECDDFPCKVKLDRAEVEEMKKTPKEHRVEKYLELVMKRVDGYRKTEKRREYEMPGTPTDPWVFFDKHGYADYFDLPDSQLLFSRKLDFGSDRAQPLHQVLDRRMARTRDGSHAEVWVRDAYTDHYFDSWGEWEDWSCDPATKTGVLVLVVQGEMDFLKKTDMLSRAYAGKFRSVFEENAKKYLDHKFEAILKLATAQPVPSPGQKAPGDTK